MRPSYPRYFYGKKWTDSYQLLCMTARKSGYLLDIKTGERTDIGWPQDYGINVCEDHLTAGNWIEGSEYGPCDSELSWLEHVATQKVIQRLTGAAA